MTAESGEGPVERISRLAFYVGQKVVYNDSFGLSPRDGWPAVVWGVLATRVAIRFQDNTDRLVFPEELTDAATSH